LVKKAQTRDQDFLEHMFVATNHQYMMFFTQKENVSGCVFMKYRKEVKQPKVERFKILLISSDDGKIYLYTRFKDQDYIKNHNLIMVTKKGQVKKTSLEKYSKPR
jgi:DNA gyrase subunit A